jgi:hypothetical protein
LRIGKRLVVPRAEVERLLGPHQTGRFDGGCSQKS